ncbi:aldehyde dehydrogenase [Ferrimonas marina]|uniref:Gamma-glutamyl-gamma-aminobutyraldehyde dehydrogenase n=1 Tax=Ferrimonas marina TaxID=299255 RepID=A0A1M5ZHR9_9GAMM|nr:aldehyde dehydrogenase [Ferrimonas marina]SHI23865.1 gamma-glutamyl-gamma-aminobutyraldehyde dehydrogenase [Ferrimonas marina]
MTVRDRTHWHAAASALALPSKAFIDGQFQAAANGATFDCINPATGQLLTQVASCDVADAELAVAAARRAFEQGDWCQLAPTERKRILCRWADLIEAHIDTLALLESLDMGKPIGDALGYDAPATARAIRWHAEAIDKLYDEVAPVDHSALALVTREPLGVVAAVVPWNFPLVMAAWKLGPSLATGNSVILKPSEKSPLGALFLASLAQEAGLPPGVFNVLPGFGHTVGEALAMHMDVDCITFTGSTAVGKHLLECAGRSNMKRAFMECGGKSAHIVCADVADMDKAAATAAAAIFYNQGEVCTAGSRLLLDRAIAAPFIERLKQQAEQWQPGDPLDPNSAMGAIVDEAQMQRVLRYIEIGQAEGATLLCGGKAVRQDSGGYFIEPTIFTDVTPNMTIAQEEIFGPVLVVLSFDGIDQAVAIANDSDYGLAAGLWTSDIKTAIQGSRALRAGTVFVNNWDGGDMTMPFGGYKQSGNGRDKSLHAMEKYTELKSTWIEL